MDLQVINTPKEISALVTCRVPVDLKADMIRFAGKRGYNVSQFMAFVIEKAMRQGDQQEIDFANDYKKIEEQQEQIAQLQNKQDKLEQASKKLSEEVQYLGTKGQKLSLELDKALNQVKALEQDKKLLTEDVKRLNQKAESDVETVKKIVALSRQREKDSTGKIQSLNAQIQNFKSDKQKLQERIDKANAWIEKNALMKKGDF